MKTCGCWTGHEQWCLWWRALCAGVEAPCDCGSWDEHKLVCPKRTMRGYLGASVRVSVDKQALKRLWSVLYVIEQALRDLGHRHMADAIKDLSVYDALDQKDLPE